MGGLYKEKISGIFISGLVSEFVLTKPDNECIKNPLDMQGKIHLQNVEASLVELGGDELISPGEQSPLRGDKQDDRYYVRGFWKKVDGGCWEFIETQIHQIPP